MDELLATLTKELVVEFGNLEGYEELKFLSAKDWKRRVPMDSSGTNDDCILDKVVQRFYVYVNHLGNLS